MKIYDISLSLSNELPVWPGDQAISLMMNSAIRKGDQCNKTEIHMGTHSGTHIDAPYHFINHGATIDAIPIEIFVGPCMVVEIDTETLIGKNDLQRCKFNGHTRILIKTKNSRLWANNVSSFETNYVALGIDGAKYLAERNIILVGIDYLSIEGFRARDFPVHKLLLKNNIIILEGLNLSGIETGTYELICVPLKLMGCDGAPARVLLRGQETSSTGDII